MNHESQHDHGGRSARSGRPERQGAPRGSAATPGHAIARGAVALPGGVLALSLALALPLAAPVAAQGTAAPAPAAPSATPPPAARATPPAAPRAPAPAEAPQSSRAPAASADGAGADADPELERQLAAARERLEAAAREVATLSRRLIGDDVLRVQVGPGRRAMLGVQLGEARPGGGVRVENVSPGGPAEAAGVRAGDLILSIDGQRLAGGAELIERVRALEPGAETKLELERDGRARTVVVATRALDPRVLMVGPAFEFPLPTGAAPLRLPLPGFGHWGDLQLATLSRDLGRYFGAEKGVLVVRAPTDPALQLRDGDVIVAIDGREPESGPHALRILRSYQAGERIRFAILRDRKPLTVEVTLPREPARERAAARAIGGA